MKHLYKYLIIILVLLNFKQTQAQMFPLNVSVNAMPPYTPNLIQYISAVPTRVTGTIVSTVPSDAKLYRLKLIGKVSCLSPTPFTVSIRMEYKPALPIIFNSKAGPMVITDQMIREAFANLSIQDVTFEGISYEQLYDGSSITIPEGNYQICIAAYDYDTEEQLSNDITSCASMHLCYDATAPELVTPANFLSGLSDDVIINPNRNTFITWTPSIGSSGACAVDISAITYSCLISEILEGQTPEDAINSINPGYILVKNLATPAFTLDTVFYPGRLVVGKRYAIRIKAQKLSSSKSFIQFNNNGESHICSFYWGNPPVPKYDYSEIVEIDNNTNNAAVNTNNTTIPPTNKPKKKQNNSQIIEAIYPANNDWIPFEQFPYIVNWNPYKSTYNKFESQFF